MRSFGPVHCSLYDVLSVCRSVWLAGWLATCLLTSSVCRLFIRRYSRSSSSFKYHFLFFFVIVITRAITTVAAATGVLGALRKSEPRLRTTSGNVAWCFLSPKTETTVWTVSATLKSSSSSCNGIAVVSAERRAFQHEPEQLRTNCRPISVKSAVSTQRSLPPPFVLLTCV